MSGIIIYRIQDVMESYITKSEHGNRIEARVKHQMFKKIIEEIAEDRKEEIRLDIVRGEHVYSVDKFCLTWELPKSNTDLYPTYIEASKKLAYSLLKLYIKMNGPIIDNFKQEIIINEINSMAEAFLQHIGLVKEIENAKNHTS